MLRISSIFQLSGRIAVLTSSGVLSIGSFSSSFSLFSPASPSLELEELEPEFELELDPDVEPEFAGAGAGAGAGAELEPELFFLLSFFFLFDDLGTSTALPLPSIYCSFAYASLLNTKNV